MAFNVTIRQSGRQFQVEGDEPVLTAAIRQGIGLPYGCKNGACGSCKGTVISGEIEQGTHSSSALPNDEKTRGMALFCCATAKSDLEIDIREVSGVGDMAVKKLPCRVNAIERVADDVIVLKLQLPASERLQYLAGQYIEFLLKDGKRRSYSMASPPHHEGPLELHIRHMPGGLFTDHVFSTLKERDILRFEGPLGTFFLREDSDKPIVLLASGTGFAPIKAIIEHAIHSGVTRPMTLYWGARGKKDLYLASLAEKWARNCQTSASFPCCPSRPKRTRGPAAPASFIAPSSRTCQTCRTIRSMPAARRSWSNRRIGISVRTTACRPRNFSRIRSPARRIWSTQFEGVSRT